MPTPVGHVMAGLAWSYAHDPAEGPRKFPAPLHWFAAAAAFLPDLDTLGYLSGATFRFPDLPWVSPLHRTLHSVWFAAAAGALLAAVWRGAGPTFVRRWAFFGGLLLLHPLLDFVNDADRQWLLYPAPVDLAGVPLLPRLSVLGIAGAPMAGVAASLALEAGVLLPALAAAGILRLRRRSDVVRSPRLDLAILAATTTAGVASLALAVVLRA